MLGGDSGLQSDESTSFNVSKGKDSASDEEDDEDVENAAASARACCSEGTLGGFSASISSVGERTKGVGNGDDIVPPIVVTDTDEDEEELRSC
jgi:hypothetical protein